MKEERSSKIKVQRRPLCLTKVNVKTSSQGVIRYPQLSHAMMGHMADLLVCQIALKTDWHCPLLLPERSKSERVIEGENSH